MIFFVCLQFSVISSLYSNVNLKPKQVICLEKMFLGVDTLAVLPTGYGKSLIYQLLPLMLFAKKILEENPAQRLDYINDITSVLLVISPLNSLINDQVQKLLATGLRVTALNVISNVSSLNDGEEIECDLTEQDKREKLVHGYYNLLFAHPEALISYQANLDEKWFIVFHINSMCVLLLSMKPIVLLSGMIHFFTYNSLPYSFSL